MSWRLCVAPPRKKLNNCCALWNPRQIENACMTFSHVCDHGHPSFFFLLHSGKAHPCGLDAVVEETRALRWYKVARSVLSSGKCQVSFGIVVFWDPSGNMLVAWEAEGLSFFGLAIHPYPALNYLCPPRCWSQLLPDSSTCTSSDHHSLPNTPLVGAEVPCHLF